MKQILVGIQDLLDQPNPADPAQTEGYHMFIQVILIKRMLILHFFLQTHYPTVDVILKLSLPCVRFIFHYNMLRCTVEHTLLLLVSIDKTVFLSWNVSKIWAPFYYLYSFSNRKKLNAFN